MVFQLTQDGIVLFCAAHGIAVDPLVRFVKLPTFPLLTGINIPTGHLVKTLPPVAVPDHPPAGSGAVDG